MPEVIYTDPVSRLLTLGNKTSTAGALDWLEGPAWIDYLGLYGFKTEQIPELIRMATDEELIMAEDDAPKIWAPLHAWRALGQLRAGEAVEPLLGLLHLVDDESVDLVAEDLPSIFGMIGPAAIQPVARYLADENNNKLWARIATVVSLQMIGTRHPETRQECISALTAVLQKYSGNDEMLNGEIVTALANLDAVEAAPLVEQAYKADRVDESILGDWEDFQVEVGLLEKRITPDEDLDFNPFFPKDFGEGPARPKEDKKTKQKRKQAKESRKKNRKKKK